MASSGFLQTGPTIIFQSTAGSTSKVGDWIRVHPSLGRLSFQAVLQTASAGATAGSTVFIEVANSTAYGPIVAKAQTFALTATTDTVTTGAGIGDSTLGVAWAFIRANMNSLTTSTAGSAGSPSVTVIANASPIGQM